MSKKQVIRLTENDLYNIIKESVKTIITESQESKSQSEAIKYLMQKMNWDKERANHFVRYDLRQDITALRDKNIAKFTLGVARMFCDGQLSDEHIISNLNATLKLLSAHLNEYDRNLNGVSAQELINKFAQTRQDNIDTEKGEINSMDFSQGSKYQIVPINSFEEAQNYYEYTNPNSRWCLTHMRNMFNSYTHDGINQIYFCLREGFENEPCEVGENAPLDNYGLSMLSIIVNENGELAYCTTRWNHDNGGSDSSMSAKEVSQVVGVNFYQIFKPNNKWQNILSDAKEKMSRGIPYDNIFDDVYDFKDGYAIVVLNDKYNFVNTNRGIISNQWFDYAYDFKDGYARVRLNDKWNLVNTNGEYISNQWFDNVNYFNNGYTLVGLNNKYNLVNTNGEYISNQWFDSVGYFNNGYARVFLNGKCNLINTNGEYIGNQWFDDVSNFEDGYARVQLNNKLNLINTNGEYIGNQWFNSVYDFKDGYARVRLNNKWNLVNTNGDIISYQWFDDVDNFKDGYAQVKLGGKYNFINTNGDIISKKWFDYVVDNFKDGYAKVKLGGKWNFINTNGDIISNQWFDYVGKFEDGYALVGLNGKWNLVNTNGEYISNQWFDSVSKFKDGYAQVKLGGKYYNFNIKDGKLYNITENKQYNNSNNNMTKNKIRITENELKQIITESVKKILLERNIGEKGMTDDENEKHSLNKIKYLYHATPSCYVNSIKRFGLGGKIPNQRFWNYEGTPYENITQGVFLATDEDYAKSFVETSENFEKMDNDYKNKYGKELEIVVFEVDIKDINLELLSKDENLITDDEESTTYFYNGVIPYDKLKIVELY